MSVPKITLEQWAAFKAVVDHGSYAKAADALNKSQSAVNYAVGKMEEQLPTPALVQQGRRSVLTEAGQALYRHATTLLAQALDVEAFADHLATGWLSEVTLAIDAVVDMQPVICGLAAFSRKYPQVRVRLLETTLSGTDEALLKRDADLVYTVHLPPGFLGKPVGTFEMCCVTSPEHPLAQINGPVSSSELRQHRQLVLRDSGVSREQDAGWLGAEQRWTVSFFGTAVRIIQQGLGFCFIPKAHIQHLLDDGSLVQVELAQGARRQMPVNRILTLQEQANPAVVQVARDIDEAFEQHERIA